MKPGVERTVRVLRAKLAENEVEKASVHLVAKAFQLFDHGSELLMTDVDIVCKRRGVVPNLDGQLHDIVVLPNPRECDAWRHVVLLPVGEAPNVQS